MYLFDVAVAYNETFQLLVELLLKATELQVFCPVNKRSDKNNEKNGDHDGDALNRTRRTLCRISCRHTQRITITSLAIPWTLITPLVAKEYFFNIFYIYITRIFPFMLNLNLNLNIVDILKNNNNLNE